MVDLGLGNSCFQLRKDVDYLFVCNLWWGSVKASELYEQLPLDCKFAVVDTLKRNRQ